MKQFDENVRDKTNSFNDFEEWTFVHKLPTQFPARDIVLRFPIIKKVKSCVEELRFDFIQSLCTIVRLDWEDKESANVKTPSKGIVLSCSDGSSDEEDTDDDLNGRKRKAARYSRGTSALNTNRTSQSSSASMQVWNNNVFQFSNLFICF